MELHHSSSGGRTSDSKVKRAGPPEPSCVSEKRYRSMENPPDFSRGGGEPSCVSMKSDQSMENPPDFSRGGGEPSCVSMKSDQSMENPPDFSRGGEPSCVSMKSDQSMENPPDFSKGGEPSCVSMKSDQSMENPPVFSRGGGEPSCVSVKSDRSMENPPVFSREGGESSCVSMKSDRSMMFPAQSSGGRGSSDSGQHSTQTPLQINTLADIHQPVDDVLHRVLERHKTSMKNKYESLFEGIRTEENKTLLNRIYTQLYIIEGESEGVNEEHEVLQMEKTSRRRLQDSPINCLDIFKPLQGPEGETREEIIRAVKADRLRHREREDHRPEEPELRAVLTKGIAGIGKTVSVQKFILDWAEGKANQDVELMFVLPFRELNLIKDDQYSLHGLLCDFHPELKDLDPEIYDQIKAVFIFDGLDESRIPLNFEQCEEVSYITMTSSVGVLMTNLIKGELLPSSLIWITSRPAAANQIPPKYIKCVTEIQGFSDPQKEEYFRKRISDEDQAQRIISHIKTVRSLHIMCHIPVFCWISASVLQHIMKQPHTEIPKTLTEMYSHFLITQTNMKNEKYEEEDERDPKNLLESNRTVLLKLAELAFKQLMKGNVMFYEEDLRENSIDVTEASVYSGIFTEIFREECVLHQRKVYCFVHLSFQEFLAAVYVIHCYESKNMKTLQIFKPLNRERSEDVPLDELLMGAVDKAIESQNGYLDLFLRFLLGVSLESNQRLLQGLLTPTQRSLWRTREHIKSLIKGENKQPPISTERSINLFLCLSEMNDQSLSREIQEYLNSERHSEEKLSPGQCSALAYVLLTSEEVLDELDLKKYNTSEEGYRRLIPALTVCRKARLAGCSLTTNSSENLSSALQSVNSSLKELDLSNIDLQDSGVELLSAGLKHSHCKLETLRLAGCGLTTNSGENLSSALQSVNSSLKELDLSNNDLQDSGVKLLSAGLKSSHCKLEILRLSGCMVTDESCSSLASALKSNPSHLRDLDLTYNHPGESGVKLLSDLLEDPHCKLEKLQVDHGGKIRMKPGLKKYAVHLTLDPNTVNSRLSLSERNRKVEDVGELQPYPDHPDRFDYCPQVLSVESLTGRCYWEVQWSGEVYISVSYRGIRRKGLSDDSGFGYNKHSWSLNCSNNRYSVYHNKQRTDLPAPSSPSKRVGVYLDWGSGTLSFYTISPNTHTLTHLHTLTTTFTEPLYAGFWVYDSVDLCDTE
ncbi:NACHT, LRR and PYD domains-containing protein 12-like isoform X2 [Colossoma macropomum]|uniref:NACHT, LRR and PYD domains-containing protein 12-like isoform X2 n=1 Tax=Colossoma macropomum TaxID=42526 RepID=UPI001863AE6F|nr:NACHT, LRR and PYD domains-containing protein 12-like isoform X2 [Colossoma macropomum]